MANFLTRTSANVMDWVNARAPGMMPVYRKHMTEYYAPKNFNFWYYFGSLALLVLVNQIVTGIFLTMHFKPSATEAFSSIEYIMRDVEWGWLIRYMHTTGASLFFIVVYLHMFRGLLYGSYQKPRELVWLLGMVIYLVLMAEAFMGYVLPWGQMSFWGAKVIVVFGRPSAFRRSQSDMSRVCALAHVTEIQTRSTIERIIVSGSIMNDLLAQNTNFALNLHQGRLAEYV